MKYLSKSNTFKFLAAIFLVIYAQGSLCTNESSEAKKQPQSKTKKVETKVNNKVTAEISIGELMDKIAILQIKVENITNPEKLKNVRTELESLSQTRDNMVPKSAEMDALTAQLLKINKALWDIEDEIRDKERNRCFDQEFVEIARSVYYTNDKRCAIKRKMNMLVGSRLVEEKSYTAY